MAVNAGRFGGTGRTTGVVTVANGATLLGGDGVNATGMLTLSSIPVLNSGSIIELALGSTNTHSTLALTNGTAFNGFNTNQAFVLDNLQSGTYDNIITGVASGINTSAWTVTNGAGYTYSFTDDGANIDLSVVTAVPEPSTVFGALALVGLMGFRERRRLYRLVTLVR